MRTLIYFEGDASIAQAAAPADGKVRFANAKYFHAGEREIVKVRKVPGVGYDPVPFDQVWIMPNVSCIADIKDTYTGFDQEAVVIKAPSEARDAVKSKKTPESLGWELKTAPDVYLKRYPKGSAAGLASEILKKMA